MSASPRSYLYVPGDRPDRLAKAPGRGADELIVDLEDAVAEDAKDAALAVVLAWLPTVVDSDPPVWVRVNRGDRGLAEVAQLAAEPWVAGFCLPKVESAEEIAAVDRVLTAADRDIRVAPLVESARGLAAVQDIAAAARVRLLHLGELDLAADLGLSPGPDESELLNARALVVMASRVARLAAPPAPVSPVIDDFGLFADSTRRLARLGFSGRACIHPDQVAVAHRVFALQPDELTWAREVVDAADAATGGVVRAPDGTMVDLAVVRRARRILS